MEPFIKDVGNMGQGGVKIYFMDGPYGNFGCGVSCSGIQNYVFFFVKNVQVQRKVLHLLKFNNALTKINYN